MTTINFNQFLSTRGREYGYVRKILAIEEFEDNEPDHRYGTISQSYYFSDEERNAVSCEQGDCFIISSIESDQAFGHHIFTYYLVQADPTSSLGIHLLDCTCRIGGINATDFPRPEHRFVETLLKRNLFQPI